MSFVLAFLIFSIIVIFHELGHFWLAKANGIRVNEFCLGLGPTIVGFQRGETKYSIKLLPFGGACMMEGEDEASEDERAFGKKPVWARMSVVFAGPFFNFIMAFVFAFIIICCVGYDKPQITEMIEGYPAAEAGMQAGDTVVKMNGFSIHFYRDISAYTLFHPGETAKITYERNGERFTTTLTPRYSEESGQYLFGFSYREPRQKCGILESIKYSFFEIRYWIYSTLNSLRMLVTGKVSFNNMMGPVGIVKNIGDVYTESVQTSGYYYAFLNLLNWAVLLSANLGVMNLLPFPALDGGRLVFLIVEAIRRKRIDPEKEGMVNLIGLGLLFLLMFVVLFNDIRKLF